MVLPTCLRVLLPLLFCAAGCATVREFELASTTPPPTATIPVELPEPASTKPAKPPPKTRPRIDIDAAMASASGAGGTVSASAGTRTVPAARLRGTTSPPAQGSEPSVLEPAAGTVPTPIARSGSAAYHVPRNMKLNEASRVELWIDLSLPAAQLQAALAQKLKIDAARIGVRVKQGTGGAGQPEGVAGQGQVWVGQHMKASLRGDGFNIQPQEWRSKSLEAEGRARWDWSVTPLRDPGDGKLMLTLEAVIDRGVDQDAFPSIVEYVEVELRPWWQRIPDLLAQVNALLALFGVGLGAVVLYVVKWLRKRWDGEVPLPRLRA
jgi:hypothetical protein